MEVMRQILSLRVIVCVYVYVLSPDCRTKPIINNISVESVVKNKYFGMAVTSELLS
jgi:hypothetical protein